MGFVENNNNNGIRLTFTDYGKMKFLKEGYKDTFKYFSFSDNGIIYWLCANPEGILDITGSHKQSTSVDDCKSKVIK